MENLDSSLPPRSHSRSLHWPAVERAFLAIHPRCAACGEATAVVAHHILPVPHCQALGRPDLELDPRNLVTLCQSTPDALCDDHHLYLGHLGDYHAFNLRIREDAAGRFKGSRKARLWFSVERIHSLQETLAAYPHLPAMTSAQLLNLKRKVDDLFPLGEGN